MRTRQEVAAEVYQRSSDDNRKAMLHLHTERTIERCLNELRIPFRTIARSNVMDILHEAAPKYVRLGGNLAYWSPTRTAEVLGIDDTMDVADLLGITTEQTKGFVKVDLLASRSHR